MSFSVVKNLAVFCGSYLGSNDIYLSKVSEFGRLLSAAKINVVYGGAKVGLMGVIANSVLEQGGKVIGVIPQSLVEIEVVHNNLSDLHVVGSMHDRKKLMADLADAFLMLPGGAGSLDEFFEIFTWMQLGLHKKPCGILNINHYFDHLISFMDHAVQEGFLSAKHREAIIISDQPEMILQGFKCDKDVSSLDSA